MHGESTYGDAVCVGKLGLVMLLYGGEWSLVLQFALLALSRLFEVYWASALVDMVCMQ